MTTLAEFMIVAGAENCPPMLDKAMYNSWESRMLLYIKGKKNGEGHMARQCTRPKRPRNVTWFKEKLIMAEAHKSSQVLDEEQLAFLADLEIIDCHDVQPIIIHNDAFQTDDLDAYDFDCDDISSAKTVLMANLLSYCSDVLSEKAQRIKPTLYDGSVISRKHDVIYVVDEEEALILEEENRSKMLTKQNDLIMKSKKINTTPIDYIKLNKLAEDFGKCFVPQMQLSVEQAFWLPLLNPKSEQLDIILTLVEKEVVKVWTTPDAITEGSWGFKHTKKVFKEEVIPFINSLRVSFKYFENGLHDELNEMKMVFNQMEAAVEECSVDKKYFVIQKKEVFLDNDRLLDHIICQDVMNIVMHAKNDYREMRQGFINEYNKNLMLKTELAKKRQMVKKAILDEVVLRCLRLDNCNEVLVYVKDTCLSLTKPSEKLVAVTSLKKTRKLGMKSSTSASRSQPDRILRTTGSNMKNKVEDHPKSVKSKSNKMNRVIEPVSNAHVKHTMLNANSKLICVKCNQYSGCSKHMTGNCSPLINCVHKFL
nr:hypothetical protein [Tanacetum cinerariifolium]